MDRLLCLGFAQENVFLPLKVRGVLRAELILANVIVFLMKSQGPDQINKKLAAKNIGYKKIAYMLYGAYVGFANMPKTFTNPLFDFGGVKHFNYIDDYLFTVLNADL